MHLQRTNPFLMLTIAVFAYGCRGPVKDDTLTHSPASAVTLHVGDEKYMAIDTKESVVTWKGSSLNALNSHTGYVYISKGELMIDNGQLRGGTVEVDMNTIEDQNHGRNNNLINHLKNPDFFDVKKFAFSTLVITKVDAIDGENTTITGNLTIKGITYPVTFLSQIELKDGMVKANGKLVIDRTKWGVHYNSGKFYENIANKAISDSIEFVIKIVAKK